MYELYAYKAEPHKPAVKIRQLTMKREWMDAATYHCYPLTYANQFGYGLYFEEDIVFSWDGDKRNPAIATVGKKHVWSGRPEGTVSFETNLILKSDENVSVLVLPVPNQVIKNTMTIAAVISTSFFTGALPVVWKLEEPGEYVVPAGTNIACILPLSIADLHNSTVHCIDEVFPGERLHNIPEYVDTIHAIKDATGVQPKFYKKGIDHKGNKIGTHEVNKLILNVEYKQ